MVSDIQMACHSNIVLFKGKGGIFKHSLCLQTRHAQASDACKQFPAKTISLGIKYKHV